MNEKIEHCIKALKEVDGDELQEVFNEVPIPTLITLICIATGSLHSQIHDIVNKNIH